MTDMTPAGPAAPIRAAVSRRRSALHRWTATISRAEINAFGGIAALVALIAGATWAFGLAGLIAVYLALVPVCLVALVLITVGR